jgi:PIN domain nuclease of toxin-antitoxin system
MLNLDTHILVRALDARLTPQEHGLLSAHPWGISTMVLWELEALIRRGRLQMSLEDPDFLDVLRHCTVWSVDVEVARATARLDFQSDPADELIAATSLVHGVPLLTRDSVLLASTVVPLAGAPPGA